MKFYIRNCGFGWWQCLFWFLLDLMAWYDGA